jgi:MSHA pilin protein MshA
MPKPPRPHRLHGLTRFEFAICAAVIGVLIALALPRLAAPLVAARQVRLKTLLAATRTTAALFHIRCEAGGTGDPACERLLLDGQPVAGVHAWPAASADGIATALNLSGPVTDIDWLPERIEGVPALRARLKPIGVAGACEFIYAQAASPGAVPRIELIDDSCS